jgi:hypothetical protein
MKLSEIPKEEIKKILSMPLSQRQQLAENLKKSMHDNKEKILQEAFDRNILTKKEYEQKYKDYFYGCHGADSFIDYLTVVLGDKDALFVTDNIRIIKRRNELEQRFSKKIISMEEYLEKN